VSQSFTVETLYEDRFARTTQVTLGEKVVLTPNFCTLIQNQYEFDSLIKLSLLDEAKYLGVYVIRIFDALNTLIPRLQRQDQMDISSGQSLEELFIRFNRTNIGIIDPATEYLLYEFHAGRFLRTLRRIKKPKQLDVLIKYLEERNAKKEQLKNDVIEYEAWKKAAHKKFWYDLDRNPLERGRFVGDYLDLETMCGSGISIPPVPIVDSEGMLDIALRINRLAKAIAPRTKPYATYLLLQKSVLRNDALVDKIIEYMKADPTQLTIIKIKNLDLWSAGLVRQREAYRKLMDTMCEIRKKNPSKLYMALENWFVSFASACYGFDIVSTSMHGYDRDSEYGTNTRGSWFDPDLMYYVPFEDLETIVHNNGNRLPCYCSICKQIVSLENIERDAWNMLRREHYVLTMNEYMRMISQAIKEQNIELAIDKLSNSEVSRLKTLIPREEKQ
jgi:hypothetical protein